MTAKKNPTFWNLRNPLVCVSAALLVVITACRKNTDPAPHPPPPEVTVAQPVQRTVTDHLELTGNTQAVKSVQLVARVPGYLEKVLFQDGQPVKQGQRLFVIEQDTYQDNLRQAEASLLQLKAQLDYAEVQLKRYSDLAQEDAAAQSDKDNWRYQRDSAQANLKAAEAQRDLAALNLEYTEVKAPFNGRIDRRLVDPGNLVGSNGNTVLAQISQIDPIYVYFNIGDTDLARLTGQAHWNPGQAEAEKWPVFAGFPQDNGYPHRGYLDFAAISLTPATGTLLLRGIFPNPAGKILPGLYARVSVPLKGKSAFVVPDEAVSYDQQGPYVLTVGSHDKVERRNVKTGSTLGSLRVIEQGLNGDEWVIVKGLLRSAPGQQVTPERITIDSGGPHSSRTPQKRQTGS